MSVHQPDTGDRCWRCAAGTWLAYGVRDIEKVELVGNMGLINQRTHPAAKSRVATAPPVPLAGHLEHHGSLRVPTGRPMGGAPGAPWGGSGCVGAGRPWDTAGQSAGAATRSVTPWCVGRCVGAGPTSEPPPSMREAGRVEQGGRYLFRNTPSVMDAVRSLRSTASTSLT